MRALVANDDIRLGPALVRGMASKAIIADLVASAGEAVARASATEYAVIVLDGGLRDGDGVQTCRRIRAHAVDAPIIVLSGRDSVADRVRSLDGGADDCLAKPVALPELLARMRAISRRGPIRRDVVLACGDLSLDPVAHRVHRGATEIELSRTEFALLEALLRDTGSVLSRTTLLEQAWGYAYESRSNVVEVYVRYLREKIDRPFDRHTLQTVRGVGYRLCDDR